MKGAEKALTLQCCDIDSTYVELNESELLDSSVVATLDDSQSLPTLKRKKSKTLKHTLLSSFKEHAERPCVGLYSRVMGREAASDYYWLTYDAVERRARAIAVGILRIVSENENEKNRTKSPSQSQLPVGILGPTTLSFILCDLACLFGQMISIPVPVAAGIHVGKHIINETKMPVLCCCHTQLDKVIEAASESPFLKYVIIFTNDSDTLEYAQQHLPSRCRVFSLQDVVEAGSRVNQGLPNNSENIHTVFYTSGSTGLPKGVALSEDNWNKDLANYLSKDSLVTLSYMPLSHITDRHHLYVTLHNGGRVGLITDSSVLFQRIQAIRPSIMFGAPAVYDTILQVFEDKYGILDLKDMKQMKAFSKTFLNEYLGGRLKTFVSGGAALAPIVKAFLKTGFGSTMIDGYGSTETGNIALNGKVQKGVKFKTLDVPEQRFYRTDKPYPRGEIVVKTERMFKYYYNNPKKTAEVFTEDGWFRMGDIVEVIDKSHIRVIGRKTAIVKLSIAEFVNPASLEITYSRSPFVHQIFIHGSNSCSYLVAILVPERDLLIKWGIENGFVDRKLNLDHAELYEKEYIALCQNPKAMSYIIAEMNSIAHEANLEQYERVKKVYLEPERFSETNQKLTPSLKLSRPNLKRIYSKQLNLMQGLDVKLRKAEQTKKGKNLKSPQDVFMEIKTILSEVVDMNGSIEVFPSDSLIDHGLNSLSAMRISERILNRFSYDVEGSALLNPSLTIGSLTVKIENELCTRDELEAMISELGIEAVSDLDHSLVEHGMNSIIAQRLCYLIQDEYDKTIAPGFLLQPQTSVKLLAHEICRSKSRSEDILDMNKLETKLVKADSELDSTISLSTLTTTDLSSRSGSVFVSGCTGFIAPFLIKSLLKTLPHGAVIYCHVRTKSRQEAEAEDRLYSTFEKYGIFLEENGLEKLKVVVGDLSESQLGLKDNVWEAICKECTSIYHLGAKVSMVSSYEMVREANVKGSEEILRMASTYKNKLVHFFSTTDILSVKSSNSARNEAFVIGKGDIHPSDLRNGYPLSKYVAEKLMIAASKRGMRVNIYRVGMVGGDSVTGATNRNDFFGRSILGFSRLKVLPDEAETFLNLIPVDALCTAVVKISESSIEGAAFNLVNPHGALSFQDVIAGIELGSGDKFRYTDYKEWLALLKDDIDNPLNPVWKTPIQSEFKTPSFPKFGNIELPCNNMGKLVGSNDWCPVTKSEYVQNCFEFLTK